MVTLFFTFFLSTLSAYAGDTTLTIDAGINAVTSPELGTLPQAGCSTNLQNPDSDKAEVGDPMVLEASLQSEAPVPPDFEIKDPVPLLWEDSDSPERVYWSRYAYRVINPVLDDLNKAKDIAKFCPNYKKLSRDQQIMTWGQIFAAIAFWESSFEPTNNTKEEWADKGTDAVTKMPVFSSGLLQLSYQDSITYQKQGFCHFDWVKDEPLMHDDASKVHASVFNPYTNLYCGINIMATNVKKIGKIVTSHSYYWSTLQHGNLFEDREGQIKRMVHQLPFCGGNKVVDSMFRIGLDPALEFIREHVLPKPN